MPCVVLPLPLPLPALLPLLLLPQRPVRLCTVAMGWGAVRLVPLLRLAQVQPDADIRGAGQEGGKVPAVGQEQAVVDPEAIPLELVNVEESAVIRTE